MNSLHPGARWQFRIAGYSLLLFLGIFLSFSLFTTFLVKNTLMDLARTGYLYLLGYLIFVIIFSEIYARMSYNRWFYNFTSEGLRLERGIIWKKYSNIPYERIQNIDIHRGIIARILGFSSLLIQTAGYSAHTYAEGYIPALEVVQAEQFRKFVLKKIQSSSKKGGI